MSWNYRVIKKITPYKQLGRWKKQTGYGIYEVYYKNKSNDIAAIEYITEKPMAPYGTNKKEIKEDVEMMKRAFELPVLNMTELNRHFKNKEKK